MSDTLDCVVSPISATDFDTSSQTQSITSYSNLLFDSNTHTQIQFDLVNGQIQFEPGIRISVVLDCAPSRPISNISDSNILHPVESIIDTILNDRSILTRGKRGICKKKCFLSIMSPMSSFSSYPAFHEPHTVKSALQVSEWKPAMQEESDALMK